MRLIDGDALEKEGWSLHRTIRVDKNTSEYQTKPLKQVPTIEPERKKGKKIVKSNGMMGYWICDQCNEPLHPDDNFCPNCGADMREETDAV